MAVMQGSLSASLRDMLTVHQLLRVDQLVLVTQLSGAGLSLDSCIASLVSVHLGSQSNRKVILLVSL